jgi:hypothetical protein
VALGPYLPLTGTFAMPPEDTSMCLACSALYVALLVGGAHASGARWWPRRLALGPRRLAGGWRLCCYSLPKRFLMFRVDKEVGRDPKRSKSHGRRRELSRSND